MNREAKEGGGSRKILLWTLGGMGILLLVALLVGGGFWLSRQKAGNTSDVEEADGSRGVDDVTFLIGTADRMTREAAVLTDPFVLEQKGMMEELMPYAEIAAGDLKPVCAYYCDDPEAAFWQVFKDSGLEEMGAFLSGDYEEYFLRSMPMVLAGRLGGAEHLAAMSVSAYSRILHAQTNLEGICYVVLQYDYASASEEDDTEDLYSWTVFSPGENRVASVTYFSTSIFEQEWGQALLPGWKRLEQKKTEAAIRAVAGYDYRVPDAEKCRLDSRDYLEIAEKTADVLETCDFAEHANLLIQDTNILSIVQERQADFRDGEPEYTLYSGKNVQKLWEKQLAETEEQFRSESAKGDAETALVMEHFIFLWNQQALSYAVATYGVESVAANSVLQSGFGLARSDSTGVMPMPKPKNWDGPVVVTMKYDKTVVGLYFSDVGNEYISVTPYFLGERDGLDEYLEKTGFFKVEE